MTRITTKEKYKIVRLLETQNIYFISTRYYGIGLSTVWTTKGKR